MIEEHKFYTTNELAALLRVHRVTITKMAQNGEIPGAFRFGANWRFPAETVASLSKPNESAKAAS